ncbi:MAG: phosphatase PAP2 family protein, partial [Lachnospiraceae bacterium]|nr:phosphatase PAP2 family protein [Lachnospiraceae bacterium]
MKQTDYAVFYSRITERLRNSRYGVTALNLTNRLLTTMMYILYPLLLILVLISDIRKGVFPAGREFLVYLLVPGISFVLLSLIRDRMNWKRPYEEHPIRPLIKKDTTGHSMPSRHVFSCTIIAMCILAKSIPAGILLLCLSLILALVRVLGGVHYPRDTVAGLLCGLASGGILLILLSFV